jgi:hypothetical protein
MGSKSTHAYNPFFECGVMNSNLHINQVTSFYRLGNTARAPHAMIAPYLWSAMWQRFMAP